MLGLRFNRLKVSNKMKITVKNITLWAALTGFVITLALASAPKALAFEKNQCKEWSNIATVVMRMRQANASISTLLDIAKQQPAFEQIMSVITIEAYDRPRYSTKEMQDNSIKEFANEIYLICYKQSNVKDA